LQYFTALEREPVNLVTLEKGFFEEIKLGKALLLT
jgi:hypothetical protein